jgi:hypothetical protein
MWCERRERDKETGKQEIREMRAFSGWWLGYLGFARGEK